ncbi:MAG: ABC transporter permease [Candidatus Bipolaricaulaceae bacterium]
MPTDFQGLSEFRLETPIYTSGPLKTARDFLWLLRAELFLLREAWYWYLVHSSFVSVSYFLFLWLVVGRQGEVDVTHLVVGSMVTGLSLGGMLSLGQHLGGLKERHAFDYYAALPISKAAFVAAVTTRGTLLALPSNVVVAVLSTLFFGVSLPPVTIPILLLSAYAMAGFGAVIGFWSPSAQVASLVTQILQTVIIFFAPIYYSPEVLPRFLQITSYLWPTTYAATAVRAAISGDPTVYRSIAVLAGFCLMSLVLVPMKLDWRGKK